MSNNRNKRRPQYGDAQARFIKKIRDAVSADSDTLWAKTGAISLRMGDAIQFPSQGDSFTRTAFMSSQ